MLIPRQKLFSKKNLEEMTLHDREVQRHNEEIRKREWAEHDLVDERFKNDPEYIKNQKAWEKHNEKVEKELKNEAFTTRDTLKGLKDASKNVVNSVGILRHGVIKIYEGGKPKYVKRSLTNRVRDAKENLKQTNLIFEVSKDGSKSKRVLDRTNKICPGEYEKYNNAHKEIENKYKNLYRHDWIDNLKHS